MGCLNSTGNFNHWFGNIHLSGKCNRACYFCIGQHMMDLDRFSNLDQFPLENIDGFIEKCKEKNVHEINLTGTNTDPLLYKHIPELKERLLQDIPNLVFGIRTNGEMFHLPGGKERLDCFDKISISLTSFNIPLYKATMGFGEPPDLREIIQTFPNKNIKVNIVLCPEILQGDKLDETDLILTLGKLLSLGVKRINLREPYGQPHIGDPIKQKYVGYNSFVPISNVFGMSSYRFSEFGRSTEITYWDVHYVEVESVNLYANGIVSLTYPITKGHSPNGRVEGQWNFETSGRVRKQWLKYSS